MRHKTTGSRRRSKIEKRPSNKPQPQELTLTTTTATPTSPYHQRRKMTTGFSLGSSAGGARSPRDTSISEAARGREKSKGGKQERRGEDALRPAKGQSHRKRTVVTICFLLLANRERREVFLFSIQIEHTFSGYSISLQFSFLHHYHFPLFYGIPPLLVY